MSLGEKYMGGKLVQEKFLGIWVICILVKSTCKKSFWVKSLSG